MAPAAAVKRAAADLRADVAAVMADPVRDEPTHITLWRGRVREATEAGAATREAAKAEVAAEGRAPSGPSDLPTDPTVAEAPAAPREEVIQPAGPRTPTDIAADINANAKAFTDRKIPEDAFRAKNRALWDEAGSSPMVRERVDAILRGEGPLPEIPADLPALPGSPADVRARRSKMRVVDQPAGEAPKPVNVRSADAMERESTGKSLSEYVRKMGGINENTAGLRGEIEMLAKKNSGTTLLVRRDGQGLDAEAMLQSAKEAKFPVDDMGPKEFLDAVYGDATKMDRMLSPEDTDFGGVARANEQRQYDADADNGLGFGIGRALLEVLCNAMV
jgi:hypothetical protein